jgi:hypothetical protein
MSNDPHRPNDVQLRGKLGEGAPSLTRRAGGLLVQPGHEYARALSYTAVGRAVRPAPKPALTDPHAPGRVQERGKFGDSAPSAKRLSGAAITRAGHEPSSLLAGGRAIRPTIKSSK